MGRPGDRGGRLWASMVLLLGLATGASGQEINPVSQALERTVLPPDRVIDDLTAYLEPRIPRMPEVKDADEWTRIARNYRDQVKEKVVFRGKAVGWRDAPGRVEWLATIDGGPGYRIRKLRYEAIPGLWIPALLYEPEGLTGKVPVALNVNGHEGVGKAADYKQVRCINQAKRGILSLNVEWVGMGQLRGPGFQHGLIDAIDLCGTSGIAVHYLAMSRALDLLLAHENADPARVAVTGLSGGGWQTIFFSALDDRVTFANPVAGYSSFLTRIRHGSDLGDSEQTPSDLATVVDYAHLTAMMAPRPTLLTYNLKDQCCFAAPHALPPLREAAGPIFALFDRSSALRWHINEDPGTHNYLIDNRRAHYRMLGDTFYSGNPRFSADEIPSDAEVKSAEALSVDLPADNLDLHRIARGLADALPILAGPPAADGEKAAWQGHRREELARLIRARGGEARVTRSQFPTPKGMTATGLTFRVNDAWTVPGTELTRGEPGAGEGSVLVIADGGRSSAAEVCESYLGRGRRVVTIDPFSFGESRPKSRDYLWSLMLGTVGDRPLGVQADQVAAVARRLRAESGRPVTLVSVGPRTSTIARVAAALEPLAIGGLDLRDPARSLREWIDRPIPYQAAPEQFCFGLLERFDVEGLDALIGPRPVSVVRTGKEAATLDLRSFPGASASGGPSCEAP